MLGRRTRAGRSGEGLARQRANQKRMGTLGAVHRVDPDARTAEDVVAALLCGQGYEPAPCPQAGAPLPSL
jgi:hypothetical protein